MRRKRATTFFTNLFTSYYDANNMLLFKLSWGQIFIAKVCLFTTQKIFDQQSLVKEKLTAAWKTQVNNVNMLQTYGDTNKLSGKKLISVGTTFRPVF